MERFIILIVIILTTTSSANAFGMKSTMDKLLDSWVGENINTVIDAWCYPSDTKTFAGRNIYSWNSSNSYVSGNQYGIYGGTSTCNIHFEVNKQNTIIKWQWEGNSCPITYFGVKKYVNPQNNYWLNKKEKKKKNLENS